MRLANRRVAVPLYASQRHGSCAAAGDLQRVAAGTAPRPRPGEPVPLGPRKTRGGGASGRKRGTPGRSCAERAQARLGEMRVGALVTAAPAPAGRVAPPA